MFVTQFEITIECIFFCKGNDSSVVSIEFLVVSSTPTAYGIIVR